MDLSALASAWAGAQEGERQYKQRPVDDKRRELELATHQAGLDMMPYRTAAEKSQYQHTAALNQAGLDLMPRRNQLASDLLRAQQGEAQFRLDTQPTRQAIEKSDLDFKQSEQPGLHDLERYRNRIAAADVDTQIKTLPGKIRSALIKGTIDEDQASDTVFATIGQKIKANDKDGLLQFANDIAAIPGFFPNTDGKKFVDVQQIGALRNGVDTRAYRMFTDDGLYKDVPHSRLEAAMQRQKTGEYQFLHTPDGTIAAGNKKTGQVNIVRQGDPNRGGAKQHTPAEVQIAEWLIANKVAKDASDAWVKVRSARDKSEAGFITEMMGRHKYETAPEELNRLEQTYRSMYRRLHADTLGLPDAPASNTSGVPTIDPQIKDLIGLP